LAQCKEEAEKAGLKGPQAEVRSMIPRMIRAGRQALCLQSFYTAGPKEVRAWTIMKGTLAPQAAGVIHSDFERGFIKAEVCAFEDFKELHKGEASMAKIKEAGKYRQEGKNYVMQEGDIVGTFVFVWSECYYGACADCVALTHCVHCLIPFYSIHAQHNNSKEEVDATKKNCHEHCSIPICFFMRKILKLMKMIASIA
jgi:Protein of unknown function (DUF933)